VEIKSITGRLSEREVEQLKDNLTMATEGAQLGSSKVPMQRIRYVFTRPDGLEENLSRVEELLRTREGVFSCEVFLSDGRRVSIDTLDDLNAVRASL